MFSGRFRIQVSSFVGPQLLARTRQDLIKNIPFASPGGCWCLSFVGPACMLRLLPLPSFSHPVPTCMQAHARTHTHIHTHTHTHTPPHTHTCARARHPPTHTHDAPGCKSGPSSEVYNSCYTGRHTGHETCNLPIVLDTTVLVCRGTPCHIQTSGA
jgi:hypothetical protein